MATDKIQTGLRLELSDLKKITAIAKREKRSLNAQMEFVLQRYIEQYEVENGVIDASERQK